MGEFHGLVRGEANIFVNMGKIVKQEDDGSDLSLLIDSDIVEEQNAEDKDGGKDE
jgi:hypothetical protein